MVLHLKTELEREIHRKESGAERSRRNREKTRAAWEQDKADLAKAQDVIIPGLQAEIGRLEEALHNAMNTPRIEYVDREVVREVEAPVPPERFVPVDAKSIHSIMTWHNQADDGLLEQLWIEQQDRMWPVLCRWLQQEAGPQTKQVYWKDIEPILRPFAR